MGGVYFLRIGGVYFLSVLEACLSIVRLLLSMGHCYIIKGFDVSFRTSCADNVILEMSGNTLAEPRLEGVVHVSSI